MKQNEHLTLRKILWIVLGFFLVGIGILGLAVPVMPTSPFLIVAAVCFAKGSERVNKWFRATRLYRRHLESFSTDRCMTLKAKLFFVVPATLGLIFAFALLCLKTNTATIIGRICVVLILPAEYYYAFVYVHTISEEESQRLQKEARLKRLREEKTAGVAASNESASAAATSNESAASSE